MNLQIDNHNRFQRFLLRHFRWLDDEKLQKIGYWLLVITLTLVILLGFVTDAEAQIFSSNPGEIAAYEYGTEKVDSKLNSQTTDVLATNVEILAINGEQLAIKNWENKYLTYLGDVSTFAKKVSEASHIYSEGVKSFLYLTKITKAVKANPEGVVSIATQNELYLKTINEFVSVYNLLKAVAKGGNENLINGKERLKLLYICDDHIAKLNTKLSRIYGILCFTTLNSTWNSLTAGYNIYDARSRRANVAKNRLADIQHGVLVQQKVEFNK